VINHEDTKGTKAWSVFKISVATKDHIRLRQGFGGQEERREQPFFELYVTFRGKKSG